MSKKESVYVNDTMSKVWSILPVAALVIRIILFYVNETNANEALNADELIRRTFPFLSGLG